jgi:hypothetical protein
LQLLVAGDGGITLSGSSERDTTAAFTFGGSATVFFTSDASGVISLGGSAGDLLEHVSRGIGGISFSGNPEILVDGKIQKASSGGIAFSGSAGDLQQLITGTSGRIWIRGGGPFVGEYGALGGFPFGGIAGNLLNYGYESDDRQLALGGSAVYETSGDVFVLTDGGISLSGAAAYSVEGGVNFSEGGIGLSGAAGAVFYAYTHQSEGGAVTFGGSSNNPAVSLERGGQEIVFRQSVVRRSITVRTTIHEDGTVRPRR